MINIVITMGGNGTRFRKAGYDIPKYMIDVHGKTLFEWSMMSLMSFSTMNPTYIFVVKSEDNSQQFIEAKCLELGIKQYIIVKLDRLTDGQATSAYIATDYCNLSLPFMVFNIDTYIEPDVFDNINEINCDGWIPCFNAPGEAWSFVRLDENGNGIELREKVKISDHATVGIYWFKSGNQYVELYQKYYSSGDNLEKGEKYIAPMYNQLIADGGIVRIYNIDYSKVHVLGTPEDLNQFKVEAIK